MEDRQTPAEHWETRYGERESVWSGRVNAALAAVAGELTPGDALDLGCGEGGDAVWLADQGWRVTGVDLSATAVDRATGAARDRAVADRTRFVAADLADWTPDNGATYDLVAASFLHSTVELPRTEILRRASQWVNRGGHLLIVSHAEPPPWAFQHAGDGHGHPELLGPEEEIAGLDLPETAWEVRVAERRQRDAAGPSGEPARLSDGVVLLRRLVSP